MMLRYTVPLIIFALVAVLLAAGLNRDPRRVPSPFIGKPAPQFVLPMLDEPGRQLSTADLKGRVWLLNVWASWCAACYGEHPILVDTVNQHNLTIVGLNYKDTDSAAKQWLTKLGNPYTYTVVDANGATGIEWGVYGVPETFVVDADGIIRYKFIGPISRAAVKQTLLPLVHKLEAKTS